jgi:hypothetical protein
VNIATLCTADDEVVDRLTVDREQLHAAASSCGRRMMRALGAEDGSWTLPPPAPGARTRAVRPSDGSPPR